MSPSTSLAVRDDFPFLNRRVNNRAVIYFDSAATTQKPRAVIDAVRDLYESGIANVHRAVNFLAEEVTAAFEDSRQTAAGFIGAHHQEIVFVPNATYAINLVCSALCRQGAIRVLTTTLEHHSNLVPWVLRNDAVFAPWDPSGLIDVSALRALLREQRPHLLAITSASNFLGTLQPLAEIGAVCHEHGVRLLIDASQSIAHQRVDVREINCDYLVFSGHKIYGPGGTGVLFIRRELAEEMEPLLHGGSMVKEVHARSHVVNDLPFRFEAGTPNIEGVIGLAAALRYVDGLGYARIAEHENSLSAYAKRKLSELYQMELYGAGPGQPSAPLVSFAIKGLDSGAVAKALAARANVIVRSGFHCAQPAHEQLQIGPTVRASFGVYNSIDEVDRMIEVLQTLTRYIH